MNSYIIHTVETAPDPSKGLLQAVLNANGFIPNILGIFANEPAVLQGYLSLSDAFDRSSLSGRERQIVQLAAGVANHCHYCVAAHSTVALSLGVSSDTVSAIRAGTMPANKRDAVLAALTTRLVERRGFLRDDDKKAFFAAGYSQIQLLAVVMGVALKTLTNYVNHFAETPVDQPFQAQAFVPAEAV